MTSTAGAHVIGCVLASVATRVCGPRVAPDVAPVSKPPLTGIKECEDAAPGAGFGGLRAGP